MFKKIICKLKEFIKKLVSNQKILMLTIGILVILIVLVIVIINFFSDNNIFATTGNDGTKFKNEYETLNGVSDEDGNVYLDVDISSNNMITYSSVSEIVSILKNRGDAVIYFGYAACAYCRSAVQVLYDTAKDTDIDKIYYLDVKSNENYSPLIEVLEDKFITEDGEIYSPLVLFVVNGDVVSYNKGTLFSQNNPYKELDESQKKGLSEIYWYGIRDVLDGMTT